MIGGIIVLAGSIYYLNKKNSAEGWLMTIGSLLSLIFQALYSFIIPWLINYLDWSAEYLSSFYSIMNIVGHLNYLIFAVGFFMLIQKSVNKNEKKNDLFQRY